MECILEDKVLVLNRNYLPINVVSVKRALKKIFKQTAEIVTVESNQYCNYNFNSWAELSGLKKEFADFDEFDEFIIDSEIIKFVVPRIIRVLNYDRLPKRTVKLNRKNIYSRDNNTCQYCGKQFPISKLNIDHVKPRSKGGKNSWKNLVCSCHKCNANKAAKTLKEANMKLIKNPCEPNYSAAFKVTIQHKKYITWKHFVSTIYWNIELNE